MIHHKHVQYLSEASETLFPTTSVAMNTSTYQIRIPTTTAAETVTGWMSGEPGSLGSGNHYGCALPISPPEDSQRYSIYEVCGAFTTDEDAMFGMAFGIFQSDNSVTPGTGAAGFLAQRFHPLITGNQFGVSGARRFAMRSTDLIANSTGLYVGFLMRNTGGAGFNVNSVLAFSGHKMKNEPLYESPYWKG